MNKPASNPPPVTPASGAQPTRRQLVVGAGLATSAALAAAALRQHGEAPATLAATGPAPSAAPGYRLTDHVRRYYETTRT